MRGREGTPRQQTGSPCGRASHLTRTASNLAASVAAPAAAAVAGVAASQVLCSCFGSSAWPEVRLEAR